MFPSDPIRHHRIKKIIIAVIIVPIALFLMLIIIGFVASVFQRSKLISSGTFTSPSETAPLAPAYSGAQKILIEGNGSASLGASDPKVTIVEFADFACPYCRASFTSLRELGVRYQDSVKIVFRDWVGHDYSISLALAAYCAGEQNKFWEMHDKLYLNQAEEFGKDKNDIAVLAAELGIYNEQFQTCFDSKKYLPIIQKNVQDSETLEVKGTPTWFINGNKIEGELTGEQLESIIQYYVSE